MYRFIYRCIDLYIGINIQIHMFICVYIYMYANK